MSDTYQLKKIILIDSFWSGKTVLLDLNGHINLSGTNGAGKTTFLRLIQLFWGERPSNIVSSTGSKKGFLDYYLPRNSSYLIYEYQRPGQQICHVMIQSDGRAAKYKFIDAEFKHEYYIDENKLPRDSSVIDRLYRTNAETSKLISVDDYCSIIQCHQVTSGKKWIRPLQNRFAMSASPMTHIEKVIASIIEKIGDFDSIKQMLINISRDKLSHHHLDNEQDKIPFQLNKQHIDTWLADLNASKELEAQQDDLDRLLQTIASLKDTLSELSHIHHFTLHHHKTTKDELEQINKELNQLKSQLKQLKAQHEQQLEPKQDNLAELKAESKNLDREIQSLEAKKIEYEQMDAESFAIKAAELNNIHQQQSDIQQEVEALESKSKAIKQLYENMLSEQMHQHNNQKQKLNNQCTELQLNKEQQLAEANQLFQQRNEQLRQEKEQRLQPIELQKSQLTIDFRVAQARLDHIPPSTALEKQINQTREQLTNLRQEIKQALHNQNSANQDYNSAISSYQTLEQHLKQKRLELGSSEQQHQWVLKRLRPEAGSLQSFLDNEVDGWQQNIGRVIAPELLEHKELNPSLTASNQSNFYNINLTLDALKDREKQTLDKATLEQQEQQLFVQINNQKDDIKQQEAALNAANKLRQQSRDQVNHCQQILKRANQKEQTLINEEQTLNNQISAEKAKVRDEINNKLTQLSQEIEACEDNKQRVLDNDKTEKETLHSEHLARQGSISSDAENTIKAIEAQIAQAELQFKHEQTRIKKQLKSDLDASGADDTIIKLSQKQKQLKQAEQEAREFQQLDQKYQDWLTTRWQQDHPALCQSRSQVQQQASKLEVEIEQAKTDYKKQRLHLKHSINQQEQLQEKKHSLHTLLSNSLDQLKICPALQNEHIPEYAAASLPELTKTNLQQKRQQEQTLHQGKQVLLQLFHKHHRSQLAEAWQQAMEHSADSNQHFRVDALDIEQPLNAVIPMVANIKQATSQQIELHATDVNAFYSHLRQFDRIIKQTGQTLSEYVSQKQYFHALGDITVNIRSKMNDLEYWQALKNFGENYQHYCDQRDLTGDINIPNSLIDAMGELTTLLPETGISIKHLNLFDIEFTITENGQIKQARNAKELKDVSSTGLSYLALITFFTGVTAMLRKNNPTVIGWPIDELGDLAPENIEAMMTMLAQQNIHVISATPTADRHVLSLFQHRYQLDKQKLHEVKLSESKLDQLLNQLNSQEAEHV